MLDGEAELLLVVEVLDCPHGCIRDIHLESKRYLNAIVPSLEVWVFSIIEEATRTFPSSAFHDAFPVEVEGPFFRVLIHVR